MNSSNTFPRQRLHPPRRSAAARCRGAVTLEAIIAVPILVIITVAAVQFGIVLVVEQAIAHAATVASREAAKETVLKTPVEVADELVNVVNAALVPHKLEVGPSVSFALEVGGAPTVTENRGSLPCDPSSLPAVGADEVRVTVCVRLNTAPFPNFLAGFGVDMSNRCVRRSSLVKME